MSHPHEMCSNERKKLRDLAGNDRCVDCNSKHTDWGSVSFGILMCADCSGKHRYVCKCTHLYKRFVVVGGGWLCSVL